LYLLSVPLYSWPCLIRILALPYQIKF
jgi:hypothetical protein